MTRPSLAELNEAEMDRAIAFGSFLDSLFVETPKQRWVREAAEKLRDEDLAHNRREGC